MKEKSFINLALVYTVGNFLLKGINFFTVPIFTKILSTNDYGITAIYSTWSGILTILIGLGVNGTVGSARGNLQEDEYNEYLSTNMFLTTIVFGIFIIMSILFKEYLGNILKINSKLIIILVINSFFNYIISLISSIYTFDKEANKYLLLSFITTILNITISIVLIENINSDKYFGKIYGGAISAIIIGMFSYIKILKRGKKLISRRYWMYCLPMSIPIVFHNLSHLMLNQVDRVMLQQYEGAAIVGVYSFTYNIGIILNIINTSINSAWVAWYFDSLKEKLYCEIEKKARLYIIIFTALTSMFLLGSSEIIKILSPKEYWGGISLLPLIILGYYFVFLYTFGVNYEFYKKKTIFIAIGTIASAFINIVINIVLIPKIGVQGAAISTLVSYIVLFIMHEFIVRVIFNHKDFPFKYYIYSIFIVVIASIFNYIFLENTIIRWGIIGVIVLVSLYTIIKLIKNRKSIKF